mgnify:CR=1 FL=1
MNIKSLRMSKSLTQSELAKALRVGRTTVAMWETGKALPRSELLPKIALELNCTVDDLLKDQTRDLQR